MKLLFPYKRICHSISLNNQLPLLEKITAEQKGKKDLSTQKQLSVMCNNRCKLRRK